MNTFLLSLDSIQLGAVLNFDRQNLGKLLVHLFVDDTLLAYVPTSAMGAEEIKQAVAATTKITNLGNAFQLLGIKIHYDRNGSLILGH
jgi:hypothetical protein